MGIEYPRPDALSPERLLTPQEGDELGLDRELFWSWNQIVLRSRFSGTPAGFPDERTRRTALEDWERQYADFRHSHDHRLRFSPVPKAERFVGRREELETLHRYFAAQGGCGKVLLHGMGGMGKTALARAYASRFSGEYDGVLWLNFHQNLTQTFCNDRELMIENLTWNTQQFPTPARYFRRKWEVLCRLLEGQRVLLILDDMNQIRDSRFSLLWQLPCDVLITSRVYREIWPVKVLPLASLNTDEWPEFYRCYSSTPPNPEQLRALDEFRAVVQGNTLLMQLAVCSKEYHFPTKGSRDTVSRYFFRECFLGRADLQALRCLSLLPVSGIELSVFLRACALPDTVLEKLRNLSLVWIREQDGVPWCGLHPMIAEEIWNLSPPTQENCRKFLKGMEAEYTNIWNSPYMEVTKAVPICFSLLDAWPEPRAWLADSYDAFATVLWIGGYFPQSLHYMLRLYQSCVNHYGAVHQVTGSIALRVGAVYHNSMQFEQAREWYERALAILRESRPFTHLYYYRLAQAAHKMCRNDRHEGKYESALAYCQEALSALKQYNALSGQVPHLHRGAWYFLQLEKAKLLLCQEQYRQAEYMCRQIRQSFRWERDGDQRYYLNELNLLLAEILLKLGQTTEALELARSCTDTALAMRGETAKETLGCQEVLADALESAGSHEAAQQLYRHILHQLSLYYPIQTAWYQKILEKMRPFDRS